MRLALAVLASIGLWGCTRHETTCAEHPSPVCGEPDVDASLDGALPDGGRCASACEGERDKCDPSRGECVECLEHSDCGTGGCLEGTCVECVSDAQCTTAAASHCDVMRHECDGCSTNAECGSARFPSTPLCETERRTCVGCLEGSDCAATTNVCLTGMHQCAPPGGSVALCGECIADSECRPGQACVQMAYDDPNTPATDPVSAGQHCLWLREANGTGAPNGDCLNVRPYFGARDLMSASGELVNVCTLRLSTCEALAEFSQPCPSAHEEGSATCGDENLNDALCVRAPMSSAFRCTTYCASSDDCKPAFTCIDDPEDGTNLTRCSL